MNSLVIELALMNKGRKIKLTLMNEGEGR